MKRIGKDDALQIIKSRINESKKGIKKHIH